jgi:hypothetical protein
VLAVATLPSTAAGQTALTQADLSSVLTLPVGIPDGYGPGAGDSGAVRFELRPAPGLRVLGPRSGELSLRAGDAPVLPVTVSVGSDLEAGPRDAVLAMFSRNGRTDTALVRIEIRPRSGLAITAAPERPELEVGERLEVRFEISNRGNAPDTVRLEVDTRLGEAEGLPESIVLEPFGRLAGVFTVRTDSRALEGSSVGVLVTVLGAESAAHGRFTIAVRRDDGPFDRWARIPTSVFLGTSLYPGSGSLATAPAFGFESGGFLRPDVRLAVSAHRAPPDVSAFAFRGYALGPRFRAELATRHLDLAGGQIFTRTSPLNGTAVQGAGGRVVVHAGRLSLLAHAAAPLDPGGGAIRGRQLLAGAEIETGVGAFGTEVLLEDRDESGGAPSRRLESGLMTYRSSGPSPHSISAEAGWMRIAIPGTAEASEGPALNGRYTFTRGPNIVHVAARVRPATEADRGLPPNELRMQGLLAPWGTAGLLGEAYAVDRPRTSGAPADRIRGISFGAWAIDGPHRFEIRGRTQSSSGPLPAASRTVEGLATVRLGDGYLDARVEAGEVSVAGDRGLLFRANAGWNLRNERGWGRAGVLIQESPTAAGDLSLQLAGSYRVIPRLELYGSMTSSLTRFDVRRTLYAELGAEADVGAGVSILAGVERAEGLRGEGLARVSLGLRKGLPLPVPVRQPRAVQGIVFEDQNGNGRYDAGEPLLDGIRLQMGASLASTRDGRFEFREAGVRGPVQVDAASLGPEFVGPGPVFDDGDELVRIPVYRGASLRARLFVDENGDGIADPTENPLLDVSVRIERAGGDSWEIPVGPDGGISLASIRPGTWTLRVVPESLSGRLVAPGPLTLNVLGGEVIEVRIPVGRREVRFRSTATGDDDADAVTSDR